MNPAPPFPDVEPLGDSALLLRFGRGLDEGLNARVHRFAAVLEAAALPGLRGLVPAFDTLAVHYDPGAFTSPGTSPFEVLSARLRALAWAEGEAPKERAVLDIPVCYGGDFGPDLEDVAAAHGLSAEEVIRRHTAPVYRVFMLGFLPGFPYLGGLDASLATPRRATPRTAVPAGSVGIGGAQTGIYPVASPGGWHLLGRTPLRLFDPHLDPPARLKPGERLRFVSISAADFEELDG